MNQYNSRFCKKGFALISTLLFLPLALSVLFVSIQLLFYNKIKNEILQDCLLLSLDGVEQLSVDSKNFSDLDLKLSLRLQNKFEQLIKPAPLSFFSIALKFEPFQKPNLNASQGHIELATNLQFEVYSKNVNFKNFSQTFKCGAFLKWKDSKKNYGIIAVKY